MMGRYDSPLYYHYVQMQNYIRKAIAREEAGPRGVAAE